MKLMISACLLGTNCKYDGGNNRNERVLAFAEGNEVIPICPEEMGGLCTPRVPSELRGEVAFSRDGRNVDREFRRGAGLALALARREQPDLIILKAKSPSCGIRSIYDGTFSGTLTDGRGVTADALIRAGFRVLDETDL